MQRRNLLKVLAAGGLWVLPSELLARPKLALIAHKQVPVTALGTADIETMFTTRKLYWPDGSRSIPFNLPAKSQLRIDFDRAALHLGPEDVARFWIDRRIRGGQQPPRQVPDTETMLRIVTKVQGAIGYVPLSMVTSDVKVLATL